MSRAAEIVAVLAVCAAACDSRDEDPPECDPAVLDYRGRLIHVWGGPCDPGFRGEVTVVQATRSELLFEADPVADPDDQRFFEIDLQDALSDSVRLPQVGDRAVVVDGDPSCGEEGGGGWARIDSPAGELIFEGGYPYSGRENREPPQFLASRPAADPQACLTDGCVSVAWEITLTIEGVEQVLPIGEPQEVQIDGRRYLAAAQYARYDPACELIDGAGVRASAYVAPLSE